MVLLLIGVATTSYGQKKVKLQNADVLRLGKSDGTTFQHLIGNVVFVQNETTIYCDSAHFFRRENSVNAFGNVRIVEGEQR